MIRYCDVADYHESMESSIPWFRTLMWSFAVCELPSDEPANYENGATQN